MRSTSRPPRYSAPSVPRPPQGRVPDFIDTSLVRARSALTDRQATEQMASDMREAAYREGGLTEHGLELLGYKPSQIKTLAGPARILANEQAGLS